MALGLEAALGETVITTRLDQVVNWGRQYSLWPMVFGTACCAIEFMSAAASQHDISRFGAEVVRFSPRQADLMLVCGTISYKQAPILKRIYDQMPEPKWVVAMGACASSGGIYDNYSTVQGIHNVIPVDVYISGCPPRPEAVLDALIKIQEQIQTESVLEDRHKDYIGILD
ncbi:MULTISPECIES: NADH-quinone oxidoreductase subunit B [Desulfosediminicola]|uniref:NADH-quinone oxidoreductase subunit B n=1 Tax=Desulfosediminicola TaxID=2886823 RepID=UPI0010AC1C89|nr:NADH-quinone oxidoreductase subunit NuoB [Desulfosediminicola ganghwensis]